MDILDSLSIPYVRMMAWSGHDNHASLPSPTVIFICIVNMSEYNFIYSHNNSEIITVCKFLISVHINSLLLLSAVQLMEKVNVKNENGTVQI